MRATHEADNTDSGYSVSKPGVGDKIIVRHWSHNKECSVPLFTTNYPAGFDPLKPHEVQVGVHGEDLSATFDGKKVVAAPNLTKASRRLPADSPGPHGTRVRVPQLGRLVEHLRRYLAERLTINRTPRTVAPRAVARGATRVPEGDPHHMRRSSVSTDNHPDPAYGRDIGQTSALLVEDTPEFVMLCQRMLENEGFFVSVARDGERGVALARSERPELVLLDITLPGIDGFEVCRQIREFTDAYVIMVTSRDEEVDKIVGLTVGADDYVTKPFSARELSARISAMRRRPRAAEQPDLRSFGSLAIDPAAREVTVDGEIADLTKIEFDILDMLSSSPRRTFTREQLRREVWGGDWFGDDHVIDVHVGNLRKKLGESASEQQHMRTVRGVGYRFDPS